MVASAADLTTFFLSLDHVFGADLPAAAQFRSAVQTALTDLMRDGAAATVARRAAG
jgi:mannitol-1-phosphate/altronate dehydrogenase